MMPAEADDLRRRLADAIAEGAPVDWAGVEREARIPPQELEAFRALEAIRRQQPEEEPETKTAPYSSDRPLEGDFPLEKGFEIFEELGHGRYGRVFRALDRALGRPVALKVINDAEEIPPDARARFLAEARTLASLEHPNIVRIHSIDEHAGRIRLSLEYVPGRTLEEVVKEDGPFAPEEAARIGIDLCRALAEIHRKGLVHRDLKPSNVMRASGGRIVVLDFGIARAASPRWESRRPVETGGTPLSMAPEQFDGSELTARTDLYGLGVLLYWMVCGRYPYEAKSYEELRERVLRGRPTPLSDRRPDIPRTFTAIVDRAIARRPEDRFESAGTFEEALLQFLAPSPPRFAPPPSPPNPLRRPWLLASGAAAIFLWLGLLLREPIAALFQPPAFTVEANMVAVRDEGDVLLNDGATVHPQDALALSFRGSVDLFVYVFNIDEREETWTIFPLRNYEPANPIPAGQRARLPGTYRGRQQNWVIEGPTGVVGSENFVLLASPEPIPEAEDAIAKGRSAIPSEDQIYSQVSPEDTRTVLRGASKRKTRGVTKTRDEPGAHPKPPPCALPTSAAPELSKFARLEQDPLQARGIYAAAICFQRIGK